MADTLNANAGGAGALGNFIPEIWANTALEVLRSQIVLARLVTRDTDIATFTQGNVLNVPVPGVFTTNTKAAGGAANGANTTAVFSGIDPRNGKPYLYLETLGGGAGGRSDRDGKDGVQVHITNTSNLPIEAIETEYPLRVVSYGFVADSGGAGRDRGGAGLRRVIAPVDHDCTFNGAGERFSHAPWGIFGGGDGRPGRFVLQGDGNETVLANKPSAVPLGRDQSIAVETPGSGGYGPAAERTPEAVAEDALSGKYSPDFLDRNYPAQRRG